MNVTSPKQASSLLSKLMRPIRLAGQNGMCGLILLTAAASCSTQDQDGKGKSAGGTSENKSDEATPPPASTGTTPANGTTTTPPPAGGNNTTGGPTVTPPPVVTSGKFAGVLAFSWDVPAAGNPEKFRITYKIAAAAEQTLTLLNPDDVPATGGVANLDWDAAGNPDIVLPAKTNVCFLVRAETAAGQSSANSPPACLDIP